MSMARSFVALLAVAATALTGGGSLAGAQVEAAEAASCEMQVSVTGSTVSGAEVYGCNRIAVRGRYIIAYPDRLHTAASYYWTAWKCSPVGQNPAQVVINASYGQVFVGGQGRTYC